ncbi:hypothetical protein TNCV_1753711 [Trichonephila clavipes]|nr:hypothetical protein TNCV_1753711 [Trichonephila clavipes]
MQPSRQTHDAIKPLRTNEATHKVVKHECRNPQRRRTQSDATPQTFASNMNGLQQAEVVVDFSPTHPRPTEIPCVILTA